MFAPGAAAVHEADLDRLAAVDGISPVEGVVDLTFPDPDLRTDGAEGEVLVVDSFGNVITNVPGDVLAGHEMVRVNGESVPVVRSYAHVEVGAAVATVGSHGNVELAVNQGRGDEAFGLAVDDGVGLSFD